MLLNPKSFEKIIMEVSSSIIHMESFQKILTELGLVLVSRLVVHVPRKR